MERRLILAAGASILILLGWSWLFPPPPPPHVVAPQTESAAAPVAAEAPAVAGPGAGAGTAEAGPEAVPQEAVAAVEAVELAVQTDLFDVTLTNRGARAGSWKLREYLAATGEPLELLPHQGEHVPLTLGVDLDDAALAETINEALFRFEREELPPATGVPRGERWTFTWSDGGGLSARKVLTFRDASSLVDLEVEVRDRGREVPVRLALGPGFGAQEVGKSDGTYYYSGQAVWNQRGRVGRTKAKSLVSEPGRFTADLAWAGLEDQYFAALLLPSAERADVSWRAEREQPVLAVSLPGGEGRLFVGPKKLSVLREQGHDLERAVWFATNPFLAWIAKGIFLCLLWIHDHTIQNYGMAIVLSTFLLRLVLFPVNQYSMVSMKKTQLQMGRLQPKINKIREKYRKTKGAESRGKMNQELMELYRAEGVNPMGGLSGCLPLLAQFPILIGFYNMLTVAVELRGAPFFGWIHDLSQRDPYWVTPILMGVTMFAQQYMAMGRVKDPAQQQQQRIMLIMPFMFTWICLQMPSGLVLYWFVNNVLGIGQQWLVNRHTARLEAAAEKA